MRASEPSTRAATLSPKGARRGTHPASLRYAVQGSDLSKSGHKQAVTESAWPPLQSIKESRPSQSRPHRPKCCCCIEITTSLPCGEVFSPPIRFMRRARPRQSSAAVGFPGTDRHRATSRSNVALRCKDRLVPPGSHGPSCELCLLL